MFQIDARKNGAPARDTRVHFGVRQDHDVDLSALDVVAVVAHDAGQFHFSDLLQLSLFERTGPTAVFVPKSVAVAQVSKRFAYDAAEDGPNHAARRRTFRDAGRPQIYVVWRIVGGDVAT